MADQWWKIELGPNQDVGPIQDEFFAIFAVTGIPPGAALFCSPTSEPDTIVYFTPKAAAIAAFVLDAHGGKPCDRPGEGTFLVGHDDDREIVPAPKQR